MPKTARCTNSIETATRVSLLLCRSSPPRIRITDDFLFVAHRFGSLRPSGRITDIVKIHIDVLSASPHVCDPEPIEHCSRLALFRGQVQSGLLVVQAECDAPNSV